MCLRVGFGRVIAVVVVAALLGAAPALALARHTLPLDRPVTVNGIEAVCTGIGFEAQHDPRWTAYPLKIELAGRGGQWLAGARFTASRAGRMVLNVNCGGPWLFVKMPPGRYRVVGHRKRDVASIRPYVPRHGQGRVLLRFPHQGGALSAEHRPSPD